MKAYVIPVAQRCNAACWFCSTDQYRPNVARELLVPDSVYQRALVGLRDIGCDRLEFTGGGEPTLNSALDNLVDVARRAIPSVRIKLYTNGIRLSCKAKFDEVNISRVAVDDEENAKEMGFPSHYPSLCEMIDYYRPRSHKLRLSIPMMRGQVDREEAVHGALAALPNSVDEVVIRPLYPITPDRDTRLVTVTGLRRTPSIPVEIDQDACSGEGMWILAADGELYVDWALSKRRRQGE